MKKALLTRTNMNSDIKNLLHIETFVVQLLGTVVPNCRMKLRQIAEQNCAKLQKEITPNCRMDLIFS